MTHYLLSVIQPVGEPPAPDEMARIGARVQAFHEELQQAGAWVFAGGLAGPESATVVRASDDEVLLTDGPWIEAKECLGGLCIISAADLDVALTWAGKAAKAVTLPIEVRAFAGV